MTKTTVSIDQWRIAVIKLLKREKRILSKYYERTEKSEINIQCTC